MEKQDEIGGDTAKRTAEDLTAYFEYLDDLRESGVTNMYGAGRYLESDFGMERKTASDVLGMWMKTFDGEQSASERAAKASEQQ